MGNWNFRPMKRHELCGTKITLAQKVSAEYLHKIIEFRRFVISARKKYNLNLNQSVNINEVCLIFDAPLNRTVDAEKTKSMRIRTTSHGYIHFTVVLACCAD